MTKLIVAFRSFAKARKKLLSRNGHTFINGMSNVENESEKICEERVNADSRKT